MSTFMANPGNIERKWYVIDAADKPLGRVADKAAALLRGKHKATYTPHQDCGDHVIIINAEKVVLTGAKLEQKYYRHHTGWIGGLKEVKYGILMEKNPEVRIVINCITLETVGEALQVIKNQQFTETDIVQIGAARSKEIGRYHMMMGENPIYIITCQKREEKK